MGELGRPFGVIGVFSAEGHQEYREEHRRTWMHNGEPLGLLSRFVMRGNATGMRAEARQNGDIVLLEALPAALPRSVGPLSMILPWFDYALSAWPTISFLGKADDDVWIDTTSVAAQLHSVQSHLWQTLQVTEIYWGMMESFHWSVATSSPIGFSYGIRDCRETERTWPSHGAHASNNATLIGPFPFAKGALFFLSRGLASALVAQDELVEDVARTVQSGGRGGKLPPYEDVFVGAALACTPLSTKAAILQAGGHGVYSEGWNFRVFNTSLIYHQRTKVPARITTVHNELFHRTAPALNKEVAITCAGVYRSCTNISWVRCTARNHQSTGIIDFKHRPSQLNVSNLRAAPHTST